MIFTGLRFLKMFGSISELMMKFILKHLKRFTIVDENGDPYLTRWTLFKAFGFGVYIHLIHQSDRDRDLHDHPWRFVSFLLDGDYWEQTEHEYGKSPNCMKCGESIFSSKNQYCLNQIRFMNARLTPSRPHRLIIDRPVYTLVFRGRKKRDWGFHTPDGWIENDTYLTKKFGDKEWIASD